MQVILLIVILLAAPNMLTKVHFTIENVHKWLYQITFFSAKQNVKSFAQRLQLLLFSR